MPTPMRNVRLSDETWELLGEEAARRRISRSEVMREAIEDVVLWRKPEEQR